MSGFAKLHVCLLVLLTSYTRGADVCPSVCQCQQSTSGWEIDCSGKGLTAIPTEIKSFGTNIKSLILSSNKLGTLAADQFGSISCEELDLSSNDIVLQDHVFRGVNGLETILLRDCNLVSLPKDIFSDVLTLKNIFIQGNPKLTTIPLGPIENGISPLKLVETYMDGCGVSEVHIPDPCRLWGTKVTLTNNPVHCDCNLYSLIRNTTIVFEGACATPADLVGRSLSQSGPAGNDLFGSNKAGACDICDNIEFDCKVGQVRVDGKVYKSSEYEDVHVRCSKSSALAGERFKLVMLICSWLFWMVA